MCNVRDVESLAWNDYLAFFVIPSLPRNPAKRKNIINAPTARFFDCAVAPLRMTKRISPFFPQGIPRREHRPCGLCSLLCMTFWTEGARYFFSNPSVGFADSSLYTKKPLNCQISIPQASLHVSRGTLAIPCSRP